MINFGCSTSNLFQILDIKQQKYRPIPICTYQVAGVVDVVCYMCHKLRRGVHPRQSYYTHSEAHCYNMVRSCHVQDGEVLKHPFHQEKRDRLE